MLRNGWDIAPKPLSHWADAVCAAVATFFSLSFLFSPFCVAVVVAYKHTIYLEAIDWRLFHPPVRHVFYDYLPTYAAAAAESTSP